MEGGRQPVVRHTITLSRRAGAGARASSSTWSACSNTRLGMRSRTTTPVSSATRSLRLSRCWMLRVEYTSRPGSSKASTSCQRLARSLPGALLRASSSTSTSWGRRWSTAATSNSSSSTPRWRNRLRGTCSSPSAWRAVSRQPWVSSRPITTSSRPDEHLVAAGALVGPDHRGGEELSGPSETGRYGAGQCRSAAPRRSPERRDDGLREALKEDSWGQSGGICGLS